MSMIDPRKVFNIIEKYFSDTFQVVQKYETIDILWGIEYRKLTDNDIKALKEGKYLYCNNGEYAQLISYQPQERSRNDIRMDS